MKKDGLEELFERLDDDFELHEPSEGHQARFLNKLKQSEGVVQLKQNKTIWWRPLAIAASIALLCVLGVQIYQSQNSIQEQIVEIAPEVSKTEFYFASLIEAQVEQLKNEKSPETAQLVDDTLKQLKKLEKNYEQLERELVQGSNSDLLLNAMIINFQTRIDLLQEVLNHVESIKTLKNKNDENFTI